MNTQTGNILPADDSAGSARKPDAEVFEEAEALDLDKQRPIGPDEGFGQLWRKIHRIRLEGVDVSPEHVITTWKQHFAEFWPGDNRFYGAITGLQPGELAVINIELAANTTLSTGVILVDSSPTSFTLMTPTGHMLAGLLTFSAFREDKTTVAQAEILMRASDPLFEIGMVLLGHRRENQFWEATLRNVAAHFGVSVRPQTTVVRVDGHYKWGNATNIWYNGAIRNGLVRLGAIARRLIARARPDRSATGA
jgi:hypothetical protein